MREIKVKDSYNNELHTYIFDDVKKPKGVFQVLHGINEHGLRYKEFAEFLNKNGFICYAYDHVSQGKSRTEEDGDVVYFGKNGGDVLVDGLNTIRKQIQKDYPNLDIYLFGHSLGSMIIRKYLHDYKNRYKKIILNGSGLSEGNGLTLGIILGNIMKLFGKKKPSNMFDNMFRQTQLKLNEKVEIDHFIEWLTRDKEKTELNKVDEYLYIRLSTSVFVDMLKMIQEINVLTNIQHSHFDVPTLLMSGTHDPATNFGEDVVELHKTLIEFGFESSYKLYPEGRHDTLQEINREEVYNDILNWIGE